MQRPPAPDHPLEYSRAERNALFLIFVVCIGVLTAVYYWPAPPAAPTSIEATTRYQVAIADFIDRAEAASDSLLEAKAERQATYAAQREQWAAQRQQWARQKQERQASYDERRKTWANGNYGARKEGFAERRPYEKPGQQTSIDYDVPMPALASLDPNAVDSASLLRLGLPVAIAGRWLKYGRSGGRFRKTEDISKLYGLADSTAERIAPYFTIPEAAVAMTVAATPGTTAEAGGFNTDGAARTGSRRTGPVEVNAASETELTAIRGIGEYTAMRVADYRQRLGGFISVAQVLETPGARDSTLSRVADQMRVDSTACCRQIRVNYATSYDDWRHPYLTWKQAKVIVANRDQHGAYGQLNDLLRTRVLDAAQLARLRPYLDFRR